jgi:hypothetical protein
MPDHPGLAFASGMASHFAIDAIPHWDYPLRAISIKPKTAAAPRLNWSLFQDLGLVTLDASVGLAIGLWLYATPVAETSVLLGTLGAMLPDPLQLAHRLLSPGTSSNSAAISRLDSYETKAQLADRYNLSTLFHSACCFDFCGHVSGGIDGCGKLGATG